MRVFRSCATPLGTSLRGPLYIYICTEYELLIVFQTPVAAAAVWYERNTAIASSLSRHRISESSNGVYISLFCWRRIGRFTSIGWLGTNSVKTSTFAVCDSSELLRDEREGRWPMPWQIPVITNELFHSGQTHPKPTRGNPRSWYNQARGRELLKLHWVSFYYRYRSTRMLLLVSDTG